jgi:competence protein ComEC
LSLGDVESSSIASRLSKQKTIQKETDVMILAHHGADNGFTTSNFLKRTKPLVAIATSNYDNQFDHPKQNIRYLLHKYKIDLFTTKTGDIIIESTNKHNGHFKVTNLITGSTKVSSTKYYKSRKNKRLNVNSDTLRARTKKRSFPR